MNISKVPGCHLLQQMSFQWESQKLVRDTTADYPQHLQVEEDISLTKNCITISIQKISSIHIFILKMQQILGSPELTGHNHFGPHPPKNNWINFQLSSICTSMQNISSFHLFILKTKSNFEFQVHTSRSHFWQCLKFYEPSIFVDLDQLAKKKMRLFHLFVLEKQLIYTSCNLIDWEHFGSYFRNKIFPSTGSVQEHSK